MTQQKVWAQELDLCVATSEDFRNNLSKIRSSLYYGEFQYRSFFFDHIFSIISSKRYSPSNRFFGLYLLFLTSEEAGSVFINQLAQSNGLLEYLCRAAQQESSKKMCFDERGRYYFSRNPTPEESITGINFVRLCFESIIFWQETFAEDDPKHPCHAFVVYGDMLRKKFNISTYYYFINRNYDLSQDLSIWNFFDMLPKMNESSPKDFSRRTKKNLTFGQNTSEYSEQQSEEPYKNEILTKTEAGPVLEEDQQFLTLLKKVSRRNPEADQTDSEAQRLDFFKKDNKPKPRELLRELAIQKKESQNKERLEEDFSSMLDELATNKDLSTAHDFSSHPKQDSYVTKDKSNIEDINDEDLDENKSTIDLKGKKTIPSFKTESQIPKQNPLLIKKGQSTSMTLLPNPVELSRSTTVGGDARPSVSGKYTKEKIASDLLQIQKSIEKSKTNLNKPNQERDTPTSHGKILKRFNSKSYTFIDEDPSKSPLNKDQNPPSDQSIEYRSPKFFNEERSAKIQQMRISTKKITFGPQQEPNKQPGSYSSLWADQEDVTPKEKMNSSRISTPKKESTPSNRLIYMGPELPIENEREPCFGKEAWNQTKVNHEVGDLKKVNKKIGTLEEQGKSKSHQEIREDRVNNLLSDYSAKLKKEKDPFNIYSHEKPTSSLTSIGQERNMETPKSNSKIESNQNSGLQKKIKPFPIQIGENIYKEDSEQKSNDIRTADTSDSKSFGNQLAFSFAPNLDKEENKGSSLFSSPMSAIRGHKDINAKLSEATSFEENLNPTSPFKIGNMSRS